MLVAIANRFLFTSLLVGGILSVVVGCGKSGGYETTPVSGIATYQGKPMVDVVVNFTPETVESRAEGRRGRMALGRTDQNGRYVLTTYKNNDGAIVGKHVVTVSRDSNEETGKIAVFAGKDAKLEIAVERGTKEYNLDFK